MLLFIIAQWCVSIMALPDALLGIAALAALASDDHDGFVADPAVVDISDDEDDDTDDEALSTFHLNMITVREHLEYAEHPWSPKKMYAISDCGAGSTILGKHTNSPC